MAARSPVRIRVRDTDKGWKKLRREVLASPKFVTIGIHGEQDARGSGIGNVALMAIHEFGSERAGIPERSVIRRTIDNELAANGASTKIGGTRVGRLIQRLGKSVYKGKITLDQALNTLGLRVAADMRRTIDRTPSNWPALKPATIAAREFGGSKPLLDLGELKKAIQHKVGR